jgi:serine/threonine protein kinase/predicted RNA-binding Zn-ribbon protein involved in translation (DUF1610 family)
MIKVQCSCGRSLKAQDADRGRKMKCPGCGQVVVVEAARQETHAGGDTHAERSKAGSRSSSSGVPERLAHYDVVRKLGAGAMGEVFLGRDRMLERDVAIKILPRELAADPTRLDRFVREAQAAARLNHANAVTVFQVGVEDGLPFLVMEVMDGGSLADSIAETGPMEWRAATRAIRDAAAGLAAAHEAGLVHRDIKPANLMRTAKGIVKVADFGLARSQTQATQLTQTGTVIGTPAFMAPEQWRGGEPDPRSDLYALTCTYYALVTGRPPFEAPTVPAVMYQHLTQPPADPRQYMPRLPDGVCAILARGTQKDPSARYQSGAELISDLDALLAAPPQTLTYRADWQSQFTRSSADALGGAAAPSRDTARSDSRNDDWWRRPAVLIGGGVGVAGAVLLLIGLVIGLRGRGQPESGQSIAAVSPATAGTVIAPTGEPPAGPVDETASAPPASNGDNSSIGMPGSPASMLPQGAPIPGGPSDNGLFGSQLGGGALTPSSSSAGLLSSGPSVASEPTETNGAPVNRHPAWSALQAIGPPDVPAKESDTTSQSAVPAPGGGFGGFGISSGPSMGLSSTTSRFEAAWRPDAVNSTDEWLLVEFATAVEPQTLFVHVANGPGAIFKLTAQRPDGTEAPLWVGSDPSPREQGAAVSELPASADFATRRVRLHIDPRVASDFTAIDAVELVAEDGARQWGIAAAASSAYQTGISMPGGPVNDPLAIPGLSTRMAHLESQLTLLATAAPPSDQDPLEAAWRRAQVGGKYRMMLGQYYRPDDRQERTDFADLGRLARSPFSQADAPRDAYWVYVAPYWYAWQRETASVRTGLAYEADQAIGPPDTPTQQIATTAWMPATGTESIQWLMVEYDRPIAATQLKVHESVNPGAITRVAVFQLDGVEARAWFGRDPTAPKKPARRPKSKPGDSGLGFGGELVVGQVTNAPAAVAKLPLTGFKGRITRLKLYVDPSKVTGGLPQIDAVELVDADGQSHWPVAAVASSSTDSGHSNSLSFGGVSSAMPLGAAPGSMGGSPTAPSELTTVIAVDEALSQLERQWAELAARLPIAAETSDSPPTPVNLLELRLLRLEQAIGRAGGDASR